MEQEDKHGVCEGPDSEDTGMGSDFENSEDREGDPDEREMGSNAQDADKRGGHPEQEMGSDPREERELVSEICTGEEKAGISMEVGAHMYFWLLPSCRQGQHSCEEDNPFSSPVGGGCAGRRVRRESLAPHFTVYRARIEVNPCNNTGGNTGSMRTSVTGLLGELDELPHTKAH